MHVKNAVIRWLVLPVAAALTLMLYSGIGVAAHAESRSTRSATAEPSPAGRAASPAAAVAAAAADCNKSVKGKIVVRGGQRYECQCRTYEAGQPCQYVWVNLEATTFSLLELDPGMAISSSKAFLVEQPDGNLVVYDENGRARWSARTNGQPGAITSFQSDGNLVVYGSAGSALWSARTCCRAGSTLHVQGDGNVVIYDNAGSPLWATGTNH